MPLSDIVLTALIAATPAHADRPQSVSLSADAVAQPNGAAPIELAFTYQKDKDAASKDPALKPRSRRVEYTRYKHKVVQVHGIRHVPRKLPG